MIDLGRARMSLPAGIVPRPGTDQPPTPMSRCGPGDDAARERLGGHRSPARHEWVRCPSHGATSCAGIEGLITSDSPEKGDAHWSRRTHGHGIRHRSNDRVKGLIMKMLTKVVALLTGLAAALLLSVGVASTATAAPRPAVDPRQ